MLAEAAPDTAIPIDPGDSALPAIDCHMAAVPAGKITGFAPDTRTGVDVAANGTAREVIMGCKVRQGLSPDLPDRREAHVIQIV